MDLAHCASCGAPTQGTYRCVQCERALASAQTGSSTKSFDATPEVSGEASYRPFDAMSALITLGINGRPGSVGRGVGIAVALLAGGVAAYMIVLGVIGSVHSW